MADPLSRATQELGERIREYRLELGATQEEVSQGSGLDPTSIGKIERGERNPNMHNMIRIAAALGVDPGEFMKGMTGEMVPMRDVRPSPLERLEGRIRERDEKREHSS